jgi:hypothetical protein
MRSGQSLVCLGIAALLAGVYACGNRTEEVPLEGVAPWAYAPADTQWVNLDGVEFPSGMQEADPEILEAYVFAAKHPEVLRYMPCYCGCENPRFAHESNYDCFVDGIDHGRDVPRVSPDAMGFS